MSAPGNAVKLGTAHSNIHTVKSCPSLIELTHHANQMNDLDYSIVYYFSINLPLLIFFHLCFCTIFVLLGKPLTLLLLGCFLVLTLVSVHILVNAGEYFFY